MIDRKKPIESNYNYLDFDKHFLNVYFKLLVSMYADDTVLLSDNEANMNQALTALHSYFSEWKLKVNCDKTKIVVFSKGQVQTSSYRFPVGGEVIEVASDYKYLSVLTIRKGSERGGWHLKNKQAGPCIR